MKATYSKQGPYSTMCLLHMNQDCVSALPCSLISNLALLFMFIHSMTKMFVSGPPYTTTVAVSAPFFRLMAEGMSECCWEVMHGKCS